MHWPPAPITTERLVLRESEARDRPAFIELFTSAEVGTYIGGAQPREELDRGAPEVPGRRPGVFVVERDGAMIGMVTLERRVRAEAELGYLFLPAAWGHGYATEAGAAALDWSPAPHRVSRWCSPRRPPTPARYASRRTWGSPR